MKNPEYQNLLYIGKSNKRFTYNRFYSYRKYPDYYIICDNKNTHRRLYNDYVIEKFTLIKNKDLKQLSRKQKLEKLKNETRRF